MQIAFLHLLAGMACLYVGGELLVRGSVSAAVRLGIRPMVAGLTIVAFGTSAPELAVTLDAALEGYNDVAVGSIVGSNICNIALILGLSAIISPFRVDPQIFRVDIPIMFASAALLGALLLDNQLTRTEGFVLMLGIVAYIALHLWLALSGKSTPHVAGHAGPGVRPKRAWLVALMIVSGLFALAGGGYYVVHGGVELAAGLGVSSAVIALTVVAVGTSLPELSTSIVAATRGQGDIALGNVVGTNIFNIFAILGLTATIHPLVRGAVEWLDLGVMAIVSMIVVPLAWTGLRLGRSKGVFLLLSYAGYWWWKLAA
jgi:cation:H+ antiporter